MGELKQKGNKSIKREQRLKEQIGNNKTDSWSPALQLQVHAH